MSADLDLMLSHNAWANQRIARLASASVTDDDAQQSFEMGEGSLGATLVHIAGATSAWAERLAGREPRPRLEDQRVALRDLPDLLRRADASLATIVGALVAEGRLDTSMTHPSSPASFPRRAAIHHVVIHSAHHRAQAINMLRHLMGTTDLPDTDVIEYVVLGDHPAS